LSLLHDPLLSAYAVGARPAWLWSPDGKQLLWSNADAARLLESEPPTPSGQIEQLATVLPTDGSMRLARLRGLGGGIGRLLTCECARARLGEGQSAILVVAAEPVGPIEPLARRLEFLFAREAAGWALFSEDGSLVHANDAGTALLGSTKRFDDVDQALIDQVLPLASEGVKAVLLKSAPAAPRQAAAAEDPGPSPASVATPRRHPLRFVWQLDAEGRFSIAPGEFTELVGSNTAARLGQAWTDIARDLSLDPERHVAAAIETRDTWSDITVFWPVDDGETRLPVELSGLPAFDRNRNFLGYRGFGVCRDTARIDALVAARRAGDAKPASPRPPVAPSAPTPVDRRPTVVAPSPRNVVPFRPPSAERPADERFSPALSAGEKKAFSELAQELSARLKSATTDAVIAANLDAESPTQIQKTEFTGNVVDADDIIEHEATVPPDWLTAGAEARQLLDRLPIGVVIYHLDTILYANRTALDWTGHGSLEALAEAGGLDALLIAPAPEAGTATSESVQTVTVTTPGRGHDGVESSLYTMQTVEGPLTVLTLQPPTSRSPDGGPERPILDAVTQGILRFDRNGRILEANRHAEFLFGRKPQGLSGESLSALFASESKRVIAEYVQAVMNVTDGAATNGVEAVGCVDQRGMLPLHVTIAPLPGTADYFAVCRDITVDKRAEAELAEAQRTQAETRRERADFMARLAHQVRGPLTAINGFAELMMAEKFGALGGDRYRAYAIDIRQAANDVLGLLERLNDVSQAQAGLIELSFCEVSLYDLVGDCVAAAQAKANRGRVLIRTALSPTLPKITTDPHSARQIIANLLAHSIRFSGPGGQVIISGAAKPNGDVTLRIRDTGAGMTEEELQTVMKPFPRDVADADSTGLSLTKALVEANHASFAISSRAAEGTLLEVTFPGAEPARAEASGS
jgi:PAS domain S-box-containing protein